MAEAIWSFDVYETLICRAFGDPTSMALLLGRLGLERGVHGVDPARFAVARADGEARARDRSSHGETTLEQIHREVAAGLGLPASYVSALCALELELEERAARTHDGALAMVRRARQRADRIVFTSDMYLPEEFIRASLERFGLYRSDDGLYVSSAQGGARKRSGHLFEVMLEAEAADPDDVLHIGNRLDIDVRPARRLGLRARHVPEGDLNRFERALEGRAVGTSGLSSMFAGASRQTRLAVEVDNTHEATIRNVAAGVVAPTLTGFAMWLLHRAVEDGVQRLYFLARGGQSIQSVVEPLIERLGLELEARYLYVSGRSLGTAGAIGDLAVDYLDQEGLFEPTSIGLVDATGTGSQMHAIARLRQQHQRPAPRGYQIFRSAADGAPADQQDAGIDAWLGDQVDDIGYGALPGRDALLEVICAADHGTLLAYERRGTRVGPRLADGLASSRKAWGLPKVREATRLFADRLCLDADLVELDVDMRGAIVDVLAALWEFPTPEEARVWGQFPFEGSSGDNPEPTLLARPLGLDWFAGTVRACHLTKREWFDWPAASVHISSRPARLAIGCFRALRRRTKRLIGLAPTSWLLRRR